MKVRIGLLIVALLMLVLVLPAMAQQPQPFDSPIPPPGGGEPPLPNVPSLIQVVEMLATGLGGGVILSFLFEHFKWFENLPSGAKFWLVFGVTVGLPLVARMLIQIIPADTWAVLEPYWRALALGFLAWLGSQVAYLGQKALKRRSLSR